MANACLTGRRSLKIRHIRSIASPTGRKRRSASASAVQPFGFSLSRSAVQPFSLSRSNSA